jgi:alpha-mannosidase/mannosylglycerate hydrolase
VNDEDGPAEMVWEGADGSQVLLLRLPNDVAYSDFFYYVRHPGRGKPFDLEESLGRLKDLVEFEAGRSTTQELLFMDGVDHIEIMPELPDLIDAWNARPELREMCEMEHAALPEYLERIHGAVDRPSLKVLTGELRTPNKEGNLSNLFYGFHSSRVRLKQWNDECESLLTLQAEPWAVAMDLAGGDYPAGLLSRAWKYLLENHPHDSICGCSIDQVHKDMEYRFDQCRLIGQEVLRRGTEAVARSIDTSWIEEGDGALVLLGSSGVSGKSTREVEVTYPHPRPPHFRLYKPDGTEVPYQILSERPGVPGMAVGHREIPRPAPTDRLRIALPATLPAVGATTLAVRPQPRAVTHRGSLSPETGVLDNGLLRVELGLGGSLVVTDHRTGQVYPGLLTFEDTGDVGDGWTYRAPIEDEAVTTTSVGCTTTLVEDGPLQATLRLDYDDFMVPASAAGGGRGRSEERVALPIRVWVTLRRDQAFASCRIEIDNVARDHRVRALLPSGVDTDTQWADMAFDLVERPIAVPDTEGWNEPAQEIQPQQSLIAASDGDRGLAAVAPRLKESCVRDDAPRTLAVTLLRGFSSTVGTGGEEGAQSLGRHEFELAIVPFTGRPHRADLPAVASAMRAPVLAQVTDRHDGRIAADLVLLDLQPTSLVLDAFKRTEDGEATLIRFHNPTPESLTASINLGALGGTARRAGLDESAGAELPLQGGMVSLEVGPKEIVTLRVD